MKCTMAHFYLNISISVKIYFYNIIINASLVIVISKFINIYVRVVVIYKFRKIYTHIIAIIIYLNIVTIFTIFAL